MWKLRILLSICFLAPVVDCYIFRSWWNNRARPTTTQPTTTKAVEQNVIPQNPLDSISPSMLDNLFDELGDLFPEPLQDLIVSLFAKGDSLFNELMMDICGCYEDDTSTIDTIEFFLHLIVSPEIGHLCNDAHAEERLDLFFNVAAQWRSMGEPCDTISCDDCIESDSSDDCPAFEYEVDDGSGSGSGSGGDGDGLTLETGERTCVFPGIDSLPSVPPETDDYDELRDCIRELLEADGLCVTVPVDDSGSGS